jgi:hypothetical protein
VAPAVFNNSQTPLMDQRIATDPETVGGNENKFNALLPEKLLATGQDSKFSAICAFFDILLLAKSFVAFFLTG